MKWMDSKRAPVSALLSSIVLPAGAGYYCFTRAVRAWSTPKRLALEEVADEAWNRYYLVRFAFRSSSFLPLRAHLVPFCFPTPVLAAPFPPFSFPFFDDTPTSFSPLICCATRRGRNKNRRGRWSRWPPLSCMKNLNRAGDVKRHWSNCYFAIGVLGECPCRDPDCKSTPLYSQPVPVPPSPMLLNALMLSCFTYCTPSLLTVCYTPPSTNDSLSKNALEVVFRDERAVEQVPPLT